MREIGLSTAFAVEDEAALRRYARQYAERYGDRQLDPENVAAVLLDVLACGINYQELANMGLRVGGFRFKADHGEAVRKTADQPESAARPTWDDFFLRMAELVSQRATCRRAKHGCVLVDTRHQVISTGYNGSPTGMPHCMDEGVGCLLIDGHCRRCYHAEDNAIMQAHERGLSLQGATAYITGTPCEHCANKLIAAGVKRVVVRKSYGKSRAPEWFKAAGIEYICRSDEA